MTQDREKGEWRKVDTGSDVEGEAAGERYEEHATPTFGTGKGPPSEATGELGKWW